MVVLTWRMDRLPPGLTVRVLKNPSNIRRIAYFRSMKCTVMLMACLLVRVKTLFVEMNRAIVAYCER